MKLVKRRQPRGRRSTESFYIFTKSHVVHAMGTCSNHGGGGQALRRPTGLDIVMLWTHQINGSLRKRERTGEAGGEGGGGEIEKEST